MKKTFLLLALIVLIPACSSFAASTPTLEPTQVPTKTSTPEPTPTSTLTPEPTLTPTAVSTLPFYAVEPTIAATSASCRQLPKVICVSNLTISLSGRKLDKYGVTVSYPGSSETSFECPFEMTLLSFGENTVPVRCDSERITFISVGLTEITLTITWDGGSVTNTLHPVFHVEAPEGPDCWPQCQIGEAEMNIP